MNQFLLNLSRTALSSSCALLLIIPQYSSAANFTDGFESGSFSHSQNQISWGGTAGDIPPVVSKDNPKDGNYSVKFTFKGDPNTTRGTGSKLQFNLGNYYRDVWVQFDVFFPSNWSPRDRDAKAHNKGPIMLWSDNGWHDDLKSYSSYEAWNAENWPTGIVSYNRGGYRGHVHPKLDNSYFYYPNPKKDLGRWVNIVARIKFATSASANDGIFQIWKDGVLGLDASNVNNYLKNNKPGVNFGYIFGPADTGFNIDTNIYLDNVVISDQPLTGSKDASTLYPPNPPLVQ